MSVPLGISAFGACSLAWVVWISWLEAYVAGKLESVRSSSCAGIFTAQVTWISTIGVCSAVGGTRWCRHGCKLDGFGFYVGGVDRDML